VGRIGEELRKKKPEHFVDETSLADLHASLERAAWILEHYSHADIYSEGPAGGEPSASPLIGGESSSRN